MIGACVFIGKICGCIISERIKKVKIPLRDAMDETFINFPTKNQTTTDKATSIGKNAAKTP